MRLLLLFLLFWPSPIVQESKTSSPKTAIASTPLPKNRFNITSGDNRLILWNTGGGLWITYADPQACLHFDIGGRVFPNEVSFCKGRENLLFMSHWDRQHLNFVTRLKKLVGNLCLKQAPIFTKNPYSRLQIPLLQACSKNPLSITVENLHRVESRMKSENSNSRVWLLDRRVLVLADATKFVGNQIATNNSLAKVTGMSLSNDGSPRAFSSDLLKALPNLRWIQVTGRRRFTQTVYTLLKQRNIAMLRTKDWGHLTMQFAGDSRLHSNSPPSHGASL